MADIKDLELMEQIVRKKHPEMTEALETYLSNTACYWSLGVCVKK